MALLHTPPPFLLFISYYSSPSTHFFLFPLLFSSSPFVSPPPSFHFPSPHPIFHFPVKMFSLSHFPAITQSLSHTFSLFPSGLAPPSLPGAVNSTLICEQNLQAICDSVSEPDSMLYPGRCKIFLLSHLCKYNIYSYLRRTIRKWRRFWYYKTSLIVLV